MAEAVEWLMRAAIVIHYRRVWLLWITRFFVTRSFRFCSKLEAGFPVADGRPDIRHKHPSGFSHFLILMTENYAINSLAARFSALWLRLAPTADADQVFAELHGFYSGLERYYHGWAHIVHCLREFDAIADLADNPDALELALWFHDAVYTPGAGDNELLSAALFRRWGGQVFTAELVDTVCALILITTHSAAPGNADQAFVLDIDLSSFGADWPAYCSDSANIRQEQQHLADALYYPAHGRFLKQLLLRPRIFYTDYFYGRYEKPARRNITERLATEAYHA